MHRKDLIVLKLKEILSRNAVQMSKSRFIRELRVMYLFLFRKFFNLDFNELYQFAVMCIQKSLMHFHI